MRRTFIAVDISQEAREMAAGYIDALQRSFPTVRVGWEVPAKLHLTLKFLGDVDEATADTVNAAVRSVAAGTEPFRITLARTGRFPLKGDPRILWLGIADAEDLSRVAASVEKALHPLGFEPERRRFEPHLTIARLREPSRSGELSLRHTANDFGPVEIRVDHLSIYESKLQPSGSVYKRLATLGLGEPE